MTRDPSKERSRSGYSAAGSSAASRSTSSYSARGGETATRRSTAPRGASADPRRTPPRESTAYGRDRYSSSRPAGSGASRYGASRSGIPVEKTPAVTSREYPPHHKEEKQAPRPAAAPRKKPAAPGKPVPQGKAPTAPSQQGKRPASAPRPPQKQPGKKKGARRRVTPIGILWVLVLCMVLVVGGIWAGGYYNDTVVDGVYVDGIHLGGLTYDEAEARLAEESQVKLSRVGIDITDSEGGRTWHWNAEDIGAYISLDDVMAQVRGAGRQGSVFQRVREVRALRDVPVAFYTEIGYDADRLDVLVDAITAEVNSEPSNAKVTFRPDEERMWTYTEEVPGKELNEELLVQQVMQDLVGDYSARVEITTEDVMPHYTVELLRQSTEKAVRFQTEVTGSSNRKDNIRQALKALNGKILWPGQELSFNAATGERTAENGYKEAPTIGTNKGFEDNLGGGVCQVSTTLYNAALMADCTIVKWRSHSFPSTYVDKGLDAVVDWPHKDLVIRNDTEGPMFIRASYYRDKAEIIIYRLPFPDGITHIKLTSTVLFEGETPIPEERVDVEGTHVIYDDETYKEVLPRPYLEVRNTQQFFAGSELVEEKEIHVVKFQEIKGLTYIGKTPASQRTEDLPEGGEPTQEPEVESND